MPPHLKSLVVILALAAIVFAFARSPVCALASTRADFERRRNIWFAITLAAFLAHNYWIFIALAAVILYFAARRDSNKFALYCLLLFAIPAIPKQVSGFGPVSNLFVIDYYRLLALAILLPAYLSLRRQPGSERFGRLLPDKFLLGYLVLNFLLRLNVDTFTSTLRHGVFYAFVDTFLPYYVASRSLRDITRFRDALASFAVAALVAAATGAFEFSWRWLLYSSLDSALGVNWELGNYIMRGEGVLRAVATAGHPIPLGFAMAVAFGLFLYIRQLVARPGIWVLGMALLLAGLVAPVSRGPWIGVGAVLLVFVATGPRAAATLMKFAALGTVIVPVLLVSPAGPAIIDHLPFVGSVQAENITYRQRLLQVSLRVMLDNPLLGSPTFLQSAAMQELVQGPGFIDVVNTFMGVGLASGLVGLLLFCGFFGVVVVGVFRGLKGNPNDENHVLGRALLATLLGILVIIFTTGSITLIPVIYWAVAGMGVAYARMLAMRKPQRTEEQSALRAAAAGART